MKQDASEMAFSIGSRCRVKIGGRRSPRLEGRTGTVVGFTHTRNGVRIVFDGFKSPQTLHRSYLVPIPQPAATPESSDIDHLVTSRIGQQRTTTSRATSIRFHRRDEIGDPQKSLANPPDTICAGMPFVTTSWLRAQ